MKFLRFILILIICSSSEANACDVCGGGGGSFMGILPQYGKNLIGVRTSWRTFAHPDTDLNRNGSSIVKSDAMFTQEFWARFYPSNRWQLMAFVPYKEHVRRETERTTGIHGIGDMSGMTNYIFVNSADSLYHRFRHTLLGGFGVRMPTGKYQQRDATRLMLPAAFQVGSGAWAGFLNLFHTLRYNSFGTNLIVQYYLNGKNELSYDFGDQFFGSFSFFYVEDFKRSRLMPSVGVLTELADRDLQYGSERSETGGSSFFLSGGLDWYSKKYAINFVLQQPLAQRLNYAQPRSLMRVSFGFSYFLK